MYAGNPGGRHWTLGSVAVERAGRGGAGWAECSMYRNLTDQSSGVHCPASSTTGSDMETGSQVQDNG